MMNPTMFGLLGRAENFENEVIETTGPEGSATGKKPQTLPIAGEDQMLAVEANPHNSSMEGETISPSMPDVEEFANGMMATEGFQTLNPEDAQFGTAGAPTNCYPKNQLVPQELLPNDPNSKWALVNPTATGDIAGKNFLSAGALAGVNTVGQSNRNANWDIRSAPPNPQMNVSPWMQTTIGPDLARRPLDIA